MYFNYSFIKAFVTANTRGGFMRNSAPLWARGQDAFLVIRRSRDQSQLATLLVLCKVIWALRQSFTFGDPDVIRNEHAA